ncbi:MAG: ankyrin repeat domain-containing protein [Planctomycetaceae bacterium]|jgi:TPR repeat protein|nr:ankyrin repeat domain-containing protein [Planctomycetaceae bacterium]
MKTYCKVVLLVTLATVMVCGDSVMGQAPDDSSLHDAALWGRIKIVKNLVSRGADVNAKDDYGFTPLYGAAVQGHVETVQFLVSKGAKVNTKNKDGDTPLLGATKGGYVEIVKFLVSKGADVNVKDQFGSSPLNYAAWSGHVEITKLLVSHGADVLAKNNNGYTPLHSVAQGGNVEIAKILVAKGSDVHAKDDYNGTPLHVAAKNGHFEIVKFLVSNGANVNEKNKGGETPLGCAYHFTRRAGGKTDNSDVIQYLRNAEQGQTRQLTNTGLPDDGFTDGDFSYDGPPLSIDTPLATLKKVSDLFDHTDEGTEATFYLAQCYLLGYKGCPKDEKKADELFYDLYRGLCIGWGNISHWAGDMPLTGGRYQRIPSVKQPQVKELLTAHIERVRKDADQGDAKAQMKLAVYYAIGMGVPENPRESVKWIRKLADRGDAEAQYMLGACYAEGYGGLRVSKTDCVKWFRQAAAQGQEDASMYLELLTPQKRGSRRRGNDDWGSPGSPPPR